MKPALPAAVGDALELLARAWNPPYRAPRPIALDVPDALGDYMLNGGYLRGLPLGPVASRAGWTGCDLRGTAQVPAQHAASLRDRLASAAPGERWPELRAPRHGGWAGHAREVNAAFSSDGRRLASAGDDRVVRLWAVQPDGSARETACLEGHQGLVLSVAFSPDGQRLASAGNDHTVRLWAVQPDGSARETARLEGHQGPVLSVAFSPDGQRLASAGDDRVVRLWAVQPDGSARETARLEGHQGQVLSVAFSPDGQRLASAGADRVVRLWAVQPDGSARETVRLEGHQDWVRSVAFSPDGQRLASASADGVVRLWAVQPDGLARETARLEGHQSPMLSVAFSSDGQRLASAGDDGFRVWNLLPTGFQAAWHSIGRGLSMLSPDDPTAWHLTRTDGRPWQTSLDPAGHRLPADPLLYEWLWFMDPQWGAVPAFEVPPGWLEWSDDLRTLTVAKAPHDPQELRDWIASTPL
jgi:WD40 repeat protein